MCAVDSSLPSQCVHHKNGYILWTNEVLNIMNAELWLLQVLFLSLHVYRPHSFSSRQGQYGGQLWGDMMLTSIPPPGTLEPVIDQNSSGMCVCHCSCEHLSPLQASRAANWTPVALWSVIPVPSLPSLQHEVNIGEIWISRVHRRMCVAWAANVTIALNQSSIHNFVRTQGTVSGLMRTLKGPIQV